MYTLVHVSPYCYIRFGVPEKGSLSKGHKFSSLKDHVINTRILRNSMKINGVVGYVVDFLPDLLWRHLVIMASWRRVLRLSGSS